MKSGYGLSTIPLCHESTQLSVTRNEQYWGEVKSAPKLVCFSLLGFILYARCVMGSRSSRVCFALAVGLHWKMKNVRQQITLADWLLYSRCIVFTQMGKRKNQAPLSSALPRIWSTLIPALICGCCINSRSLVSKPFCVNSFICFQAGCYTSIGARNPIKPSRTQPTSLIWSNLSWYLPGCCVKSCPI